jgi:hypothetical protein
MAPDCRFQIGAASRKGAEHRRHGAGAVARVRAIVDSAVQALARGDLGCSLAPRPAVSSTAPTLLLFCLQPVWTWLTSS